MSQDKASTEERTFAVLERMLAQQTEALAEQRRFAAESRSQVEETLRLAREGAERQKLAVETQQKISRLYRGVVAAAALVIVAIIALLGWVLLRY
jgi:hypothetical protein